VDRCQSGLDTFPLFHFYRFTGLFLHERGLLDDADYIRSFIGNDLILAGGRKMSKHLGNAVAPQEILDSHGADALRVAMFWAAGPQRPLQWKQEAVDKAATFLGEVHDLYGRLSTAASSRPAPEEHGVSRKATALRTETSQVVSRVGRFIEDYRPNAALEALAALLGRIDGFASRRVASGRLGAGDAALLRGILADYAVALAPFAPHLAEETWHRLGEPDLAARARWPAAIDG